MYRVITILLLLLCFVPFLYPLHKDSIFNAHDSESNLLRASELYNNLDGLTYVRWFKNFSGGYGYPFLNFYAPISYYIMVIIKIITKMSWINSMKLFLILITLLRGFGMYKLSRNFFQRNGALLSSIAFIYVPYYICDIYVRGDFSEAFGFSLIPLVLHLFYRLIKTAKSAYLIGSSLALAGILFSHNGIALIFMPLLLFFIVWFGRFKKILKPLLSTSLGMGISSIFWLPSLIEKKYVHIERTIQGKFQYFNNFLDWEKLLSDKWGFGTNPYDPVPLGLGWLHIAIFLIALIYLFIPKKKAKHLVLFSISTTILATFLMFPNSDYIWKNLPLTKFLQFPWRLLAITGFSMSILFGIFSYLKPFNKWIFLIGIATVLYYNQYCITNGQIHIPDSQLTQKVIRSKEITTAYSDEYRPLWAKKDLKPNPPDTPMEIVCKEPTEVTINKFWFPGWVGLVNEMPVPIKIQNPTGLIQIDVPSGRHKIELRFIDTPIRKIAKGISLISILILTLLTIPFKRKTFWLLVTGFWFLSPPSIASPQYIPDPYDSQGDSALYITETHNAGSFYIESRKRKDIFIISSYRLSNIGLFIKNNGRGLGKVSIRGKDILIYPEGIEILWSLCGSPLYNVDYFYELKIKNGDSPIFIYITTDPYKLALLCMEKETYRKAIPLLLEAKPSIEQKLHLAIAYYYNGKKEKAKGLLDKIENSPEYSTYIKDIEPIENKNLKLTLTPWDLLLETGTLISNGAFYNKECHKPGQLIYGPYRRFPRGVYNVTYWIMASDYNQEDVVAKLDVFSSGYPLEERAIKGGEFQGQDNFYPFTLLEAMPLTGFTINFYNPDSTKELEFRVTATGKGNIVVKQIDIEPDIYNTQKQIKKELHLSWAKMYLEKRNLPKAQEKLLIATELCPTDIESRLILLDILEKTGKHNEALIQYKKISELVPNHERVVQVTPKEKIEVNFGDVIEFMGFDTEQTPKNLKITYYWKVIKPECRTYMVFVHFRYNNKIIFQNDHYLAELNPSGPKWVSGEIIKEEYIINIPDNIPPGEYKVVIGLWKPPDQSSRLRTMDGKTEAGIGKIDL